MNNVIPITRARRRPISRCSRFEAARARLESLRPCFGTPAHHEAFCVFMGEAVRRLGNVVPIRKVVSRG